MSYLIKEFQYTLQGEGFHTGRPAVLVRFSGCNLWSGSEEDRSTAVCFFCDTDFLGKDGPKGGEFHSAEDLIETARSLWPQDCKSKPFIICTGGEPLLQLDQTLVDTFHEANFEIAVETNGTMLPPIGIDWICVSPKSGTKLVLERGDELKLVFPQPDVDPQDYLSLDFRHFYLQPLYDSKSRENTESALRYCMAHPQWTLSLQIHKILHIP